MNYKNFENAGQKKTDEKQEQFINSAPGSGKSFYANPSDILSLFENEYEMFKEISEILAGQERRKNRFYRNLKKAIFAFSSVLIFSGICFFAKRGKAGKSEKTKNQ